MAKKTNCTINGRDYYRLTKVVGHKLNDNGIEIPVRKSFYGDCKSDAEDKYQKFMDKKNAGLETKTQYFGVLADNWISEFFINDGTVKDSTKARYIAAWNNHISKLDLYHLPMEDVTAKTIQAAYNNLAASGTSASEIKTAHKMMRKFYRYVEAESLGRNVTHSLTIPKDKINAADESITVWTDDEIRTILSSFSKADNRFRLRFLIVLAYYTGCRKSELLALKYEDITDNGVRITKQISEVVTGMKDGKAKTEQAVTDPKTNNSVRIIPVDPIVLDELRIHKNWHKREQVSKGYRSDYIFTTDSGKFYNPKNIDRALFRYYKTIGVGLKSMHTYRHTYASNLCRFGTPIETACELLGHDSISTTARYYVRVDEDTKVTAAMSLRQVMGA